MTKLEWIEIENFRGITNLRYEPKQVNLIIGRNNSGKTTILEAIYANMMKDVYAKHKDKGRKFEVKVGSTFAKIASSSHNLVIYGNENDTPSELLLNLYLDLEGMVNNTCMDIGLSSDVANDLFCYIRDNVSKYISMYDCVPKIIINTESLSFYKSPIRNDMQEIILRSITNDKTDVLFETASNERSTFEIKNGNGFGKGQDDIHLANSESLFRKFIWKLEEKLAEYYIQDASNEIVVYADGVCGAFNFNDPVRLIEIENIVKEYNIVPNLERLTNIGVVYKSHDSNYTAIPYAMQGDGFISLLSLIDVVNDAKGGILLIEEPENHMHPGYLRIFVEQIIEFAKKFDVQIFMTSHSYDLIDELCSFPDTDEEKNMVQISRVVVRNGEHELYNYTPDKAIEEMSLLKMDLRGT